MGDLAVKSHNSSHACRSPRKAYRVWITASGDWQPNDPHDIPPDATALEPAEEGVFPARRAARYVTAFNRTALARGLRVWAVALPVVVRYEGDVVAGQRLACLAGRCRLAGVKKGMPQASQASAGGGFQGLGQSPQ